MWSRPHGSRLQITYTFPITGSRDGGVSSQCTKPSNSPVYIKVLVNSQPTQAIVDTGSAISIIHSNLLKTIQHRNFLPMPHQCQTANATPLHLIGQIELEIKTSNIKTSVIAYVATNLITTMLLGNDWIDSNHVHLFGDEKRLTIPDQHGRLTPIPYVEPTSINYPALLVNHVTLPPYSQTLLDVTCQIDNGENLVFEPYGNHTSKFIFMPHSLVNVK